MSYILDALRRAERERRRSDSTVLETVTQVLVPPPPPVATTVLRRWVPGVALAAVLLVGVVGGLWLRRPSDTAPPSPIALKPTADAAGTAPPAAAPAPAAPSAPLAAAAPPPLPTAAPPTLTTTETLNEVPPLPPAAVAPQPNEDEATLAAEAAPPDATAPEAVAPAEPASRPILRQHLPSPGGAPPPRAAAASSARQLQQMPDSYRAHFPSLAVDVHVYDDAPSRRFVIIGGRRYGEGETLGAGPRLVQIVPEGMVLDWQGQRVVYALAH